jgi:lysozyme family protein
VTEDSGGRTRFGIAERFHPELGDEFYLAPVDVALETAREIYRSDYWNAIHGDDIRDQRVATKVFDMAVNMGVRQALVLCQQALNVIEGPPLCEDGILGPKTLQMLNGCDADKLLEELRNASEAFYQHLAAVRPEAQRYLRGWLARARA